MLKKLLGIAPIKTEEGAYSPSPFALKLATSSVTNYKKKTFKNQNKDTTKKVLILCTEERNMKMKNGKHFSTGNHPVEMLLPMLHLKNAGFDCDVYTPTGNPAQIERWAFPEKDEAVKAIYAVYSAQFDKPKSLAQFVESGMNSTTNYVAIFIPGGHGAMLGLPTDINLKKLIQWSVEKDLLMLSICHGPAALLAASMDQNDEDFIYKGYKMAAFPDKVDQQTPMIGYMPGPIPWKFGERLTQLGVNIINKKADKTCFKDRNLITGASPEAANDFGVLAASELLKKFN